MHVALWRGPTLKLISRQISFSMISFKGFFFFLFFLEFSVPLTTLKYQIQVLPVLLPAPVEDVVPLPDAIQDP